MDAAGLGKAPDTGFCEPGGELSSFLMEFFDQFEVTNNSWRIILNYSQIHRDQFCICDFLIHGI
jgi:hypothetical protein